MKRAWLLHVDEDTRRLAQTIVADAAPRAILNDRTSVVIDNRPPELPSRGGAAARRPYASLSDERPHRIPQPPVAPERVSCQESPSPSGADSEIPPTISAVKPAAR